MNDITILIPLHKTSADYIDMLKSALDNIRDIHHTKSITIHTHIIIPQSCDIEIVNSVLTKGVEVIVNKEDADYCSQINEGVKSVTTEYFSIMEVDDRFNTEWVNMFHNYLPTHEDVSIFLPINVCHNTQTDERIFANHIAWSTGFTTNDDNIDVAAMDKIGFITFNSLLDNASFNLTGAIFKTNDWLCYKPSIKLSFNYEYLLRATNPKSHNQKVYVIPKEGYYHETFRHDSLLCQYYDEISSEDAMKWFELAKREYVYDEDRHKDIISSKQEALK